jgi:hypothetical protein
MSAAPERGSARGAAPAAAARQADAVAPSGRGWILGWIVLPSLVFLCLFGGGVFLGIRDPSAWYSRGTVWLASELFGLSVEGSGATGVPVPSGDAPRGEPPAPQPTE